MELGRYLTADKLNEFLSEFESFVNNFDELQTSIILPRVSWNTSTNELINVFNEIETEVDAIHYFVIDYWDNPFHSDVYEFKRKNGMLYPYVKRWFDWLNYNIEEYNKRFGNSECLYTIENGVEEQVFDVSNMLIRVKKEVA